MNKFPSFLLNNSAVLTCHFSFILLIICCMSLLKHVLLYLPGAG